MDDRKEAGCKKKKYDLGYIFFRLQYLLLARMSRKRVVHSVQQEE